MTSNKNKQSSKTTAGIKKKEKDTPEIKRESPEMESLPDNTLLTPLRPFNEKDLFEMFKDEEDDGFDKIMESQMDDMDKMMDDAFDKF